MPNIGPAELIVILIVALVVFGPRKLPELGKSLGHGLREFRKSTQGLKDELDGANIVATPTIQTPITQTPVTQTPVTQIPVTQAAAPTQPAAPVAAAAVTPQVKA